MQGAVCLVTGANAGIGKATALELAARGATTILLCRDAGRGEAARVEIIDRSGNPGVELLTADIGSPEAVSKAANELGRRHDRLDVLINNAGVFTRRRRLTAGGLETQFAVNHLGGFILTLELLPLLRASAPSRVVNVSSEAHRRGRIDFDDLQGERRYSGLRAYGQSKLANILFTRELADRLAGTGVTANALHPGVIATKLLFAGFPPMALATPFLKKPASGARTSVYLATAPEVKEVTGRYFIDSAEAEPAPQALDGRTARRLWEVSEDLGGSAG